MPIRILVADDYEPFRQFVCFVLDERAEFQVIAQAADGLEAIQKAEELQPDLILLDLGLPKLNGFQAARQLRNLAPQAKILFLSQEYSADFVEAALRLGAWGYVHKLRAHSELLLAIEAVLRGQHFVGRGLLRELSESTAAQRTFRHDVQFYSAEAVLLEELTHFVGGALRNGNATVVIATKPHRDSLLRELIRQGLDADAAIRQGTYVSVDAAETLSKFMINDLPDANRCEDVIGELVTRAKQAAVRTDARVAAFGEMVALLLANGNKEAVLSLEQRWNVIAKAHDFDCLCGYPLDFNDEKNERFFKRICAEHSVVYYQ